MISIYNMFRKMCLAAGVLAWGVLLPGCSRVDEPQARYGKVVFSISKPEVPTKASGMAPAAETAVLRWAVFALQDGGVVAAGENLSSDGEIAMVLPLGEYQLCAVANYPVEGAGSFVPSSMRTLSDIESFELPFSANRLDGFVMYGTGSLTVQQGGSMPVTVLVRRLVARVEIDCIEAGFTNELAYELGVSLSGIRMSNVYGRAALGADASSEAMSPSEDAWVDRMGTETAGYEGILYDSVSGTFAAEGDSYSVPHVFYVYPNAVTEGGDSRDTESWSKRRTRLVIAGRIGSSVRYWNLTLPGPVVRNTSYLIEKAVLRGGGSLDPESGVEAQIDYDITTITIDIDDDDYNVNEES